MLNLLFDHSNFVLFALGFALGICLFFSGFNFGRAYQIREQRRINRERNARYRAKCRAYKLRRLDIAS